MESSKPKLTVLRTAEDIRMAEARDAFVAHLQAIIEEVRSGDTQRVLIITDGEPTEGRLFAPYNRYVFGKMRKAEMVGMAMLAATMDSGDDDDE